MKNITENAALHPNEVLSPVFRVVDGVVLQVASGPVAGLTPTSTRHHRANSSAGPFKPPQPSLIFLFSWSLLDLLGFG